MYTAKLTITSLYGLFIDEHTITGAGTEGDAYRAANDLSQNVEMWYPRCANHEITVYDETGEVVPF